MKLVVGLGNPGRKYQNTRHNVGYMVVDGFEMRNLGSGVFVARKTGVFMNESGVATKRLVDFYKVSLDELYVVCDDLDISLGEYKIQFGRGPKDHRGLNSVYEMLGSKDFWHVRVGVDNRQKISKSKLQNPKGEVYVLQEFSQEERKVVDDVIEKICKKLVTF